MCNPRMLKRSLWKVNMHYVESDGLKIAVDVVGDGAPLIFAHGLSGNRHITRQELAALADRYEIIAYDQRGHGDSTPITDPTLYDSRRMAEDMRAVLDDFKIGRAVVGGESMGAATTLLFALKYPLRVAKLLLTAPAFSESLNPDSERLKGFGLAATQLGMEEFLKVAAERQRTDLKWSPEVIAFVANMFRSHQPASLITAWHTVSQWCLPDLSAMSRLTCAVCILAWEDDPLHPIELARRLAATFPNAQLKMMPPLPALFENPEQVGRLYKEFLENQ